MLRAVLRETGLAAATLLASIFIMPFFLFALGSAGLADPAYAGVASALAAYVLPFSVGLGTLVAVIQHRLGAPGRPTSVKLVLALGLLFSLVVNVWVPEPLWNLFFLMPGFGLWALLSGWLAQKRSLGGTGVAR